MSNRSFGLIEGTVALIIVLIIIYVFFNVYENSLFSKQSEKAISESEFNTKNPSSFIQHTQRKVDAINRKINTQQNEMENFLK